MNIKNIKAYNFLHNILRLELKIMKRRRRNEWIYSRLYFLYLVNNSILELVTNSVPIWGHFIETVNVTA